MRIEDELLTWAAGYARQRSVSKTAVFEMALSNLRDLARGGVPELERPSAPVWGRKPKKEPGPVERAFAAIEAERGK